MESSGQGQEECRTPITEYRSTEAGNGKDLTRTGTILLSTDIDRSMEHQYMDMPTDRTQPDPATRKPDENLLQLVEKRRTWRQRKKNRWYRKASTMAENGTDSNKTARDLPSNGTSALQRKRIVRSHQRSENCKMVGNLRKKLPGWLDHMDRNIPPELRSMRTEDERKSRRMTENLDASSQVQAAMEKTDVLDAPSSRWPEQTAMYMEGW